MTNTVHHPVIKIHIQSIIITFSMLLHGCIPISDPDIWPSDFVQKKDLPELVGKNEQEVLRKLGPPKYVVQKPETVSYLYQKLEEDTMLMTVLFIPMPERNPEKLIEASCVLLNFDKDSILTEYKLAHSSGRRDCVSLLGIKQYDLVLVNPLIYYAIEGDFEAIRQYKIYTSRPIKDHSRLTHLCNAADKGHPNAQNEVGRHLAQGNYGLNIDILNAYVWYSLAAKSGFNQSKAALIKQMTSQQITEAEQLLNRWKPGQCVVDLAIANIDR